MLKLSIKDEINANSSLKFLPEKGSFLNIFLYLAQAQPGKIEYICHFLQKYKIKLGFLTKKKRFSFKNYFHANANFVAQSAQLISESDFATINHFLSSQVIIVSISYQNQIWTVSRFLKWHKVFSQIRVLPNQVHEKNASVVRTHLVQSNNNEFCQLWLFFKQIFF